MKFPFIHQLEAKDCGPVCIQMITAYYGNKFPLHQLKTLCDISRQGASAFDITECLKKIKFEVSAASIKFDQIKRMPLPAILYWRQDHYVVLYNIQNKGNKSYYHIADPAYGKLKINEETFCKSCINGNEAIVIVMQPTEAFFETDIRKENTVHPFLRLLKLFSDIMKRYRTKVSIALILLIVSIILNWIFPVLLKRIIDDGVIKENLSVVFKLLLFQFTFFCGYFISNALSNIILTKINFNVSIKYLSEYLYKLVKLPIKFFDSRLNTDLIQRMDDQEKIQSFLTYRFLDFFFTILNLIVFTSLLAYYSVGAFGIFFLLSAISILWTVLFLKKRKRLDYDRFFVNSENKNNIYEMIYGMSEIKINTAEEVRINRWELVQRKQNAISLRALYLNQYQVVGSSFINRLRDIAITGLCAYFVIGSNMTLGVMMTISYILGQLSGPMSQLTQFTTSFQDATNSLERLEDIQMRDNEDDKNKISPPTKINEGFVLQNVSFKYIENSNFFVIKGLSLNIPKGKVTAIVGVSGSGKTTLMKLLLSFYYPQEGDIFLDGTKMNQINAREWRRMCGVVMQDGYIFSSTILENIALRDEQPDLLRVKQAAELACINEFIDQLPLGYNTKIGKAGMEISGGQKQRILIARAIYNNPEFIILDEATSSLDANNELAILKNLDNFFKGKTVVIVAHRLSTVKNADNIVVMEKGQIVEEGTHNELSTLDGAYFNLVRNQLELGQ